MRTFTVFFLFLSSLINAQNNRFIYEYKFISDTLSKEDLSTEMVVLDYNSKDQSSVFTGLKNIVSDSIMATELKKGNFLLPDKTAKVRYVVEKKLSEKIVYYYTPNHTATEVLKIKDDRVLNWKILNDKDNFLGYNVQKATINFAGRIWFAWFTPEIPISDGPYKFNGLPGLILKIFDKTDTHSFEIKSIQKDKGYYKILDSEEYNKAKITSLLAYKKLPQDPLELFRLKALSGGVIFNDAADKEQFLKKIDDQIKFNKIHDNNPIEILYKK